MRFQYLPTGLAVLLAGPALATETAAPPAQVADVLRCRSVQDAQARLQCYDSAVGSLSSAVAAGDVVAIDRDAIARERRSLFGFSLPRIGLFGGSDDAPEARELEAVIQSAARIGHGRWLLSLDNGAQWETTESLSNQVAPRAGQKVKIKRGAIGGFMASIDGSPLRRVKRVQ